MSNPLESHYPSNDLRFNGIKNGLDASLIVPTNSKSQSFFPILIDFPALIEFNGNFNSINRKQEQSILNAFTSSQTTSVANINNPKTFRLSNDYILLNTNSPFKRINFDFKNL